MIQLKKIINKNVILRLVGFITILGAFVFLLAKYYFMIEFMGDVPGYDKSLYFEINNTKMNTLNTDSEAIRTQYIPDPNKVSALYQETPFDL